MNERFELASDPAAEVRRGIAEGLRPAVPGALALLRKLVADADPEVRAAARKSLGDAAEAPWWTGMLSADPASLVGEARAAKIRPLLDDLLAKLSVADYSRASTFPDIVPLVRKLPQPIAAEVAERALLLVDYRTKDCIGPLTRQVLAGPGVEAALDRLAAHWCENGRPLLEEEPVAEAIAALPARTRAEQCRRLARLVLAAPVEERQVGSVAQLRGELAGRAWPKSLDYGFVIDGIDALEHEEGSEEDEPDAAIGLLAKLLDRAAPRLGHVPRLADRFTHPPSKTWREISRQIGLHLDKLPPRPLRAIAERAAASAESTVVCWGLEVLASKAHAKGDPQVGDLLRAWVADPRLRGPVASSRKLLVPALPWLRERLAAGELEFAAAVETIRACLAKTETMVRDPRARPRVAPLTEDEWAAYRSARDRATIAQTYEWSRALSAVPAGPRHPANQSFWARALEATKQDRDLVFWLTHALTETCDEASLADATALLAASSGDDRDSVRKTCDVIAKKLGVPPPADPVTAEIAASVAQAPARAREWMDEPEETED